MAFEAEAVFGAAGVAAAVSGSLASLFATSGRGLGHHKRAVGLAYAAFFLLAASALSFLFEVEGSLLSRLTLVHEGRNVGLAWLSAVGAFCLAANGSVWQRRHERTSGPSLDARHPAIVTLGVGLALVAWVGLEFLIGSSDRSTAGVREGASARFLVFLPAVVVGGTGILVGAATLAHLATGRREWADVALPWARVGFLAGWLGLMMDAALLPRFFFGLANWALLGTMLALVPFMHGLIYLRKKRLMRVLSPFFGVWLLPLSFMTVVSSIDVGPGADPRVLLLAWAAVSAMALLLRPAILARGVRRAAFVVLFIAFGAAAVFLRWMPKTVALPPDALGYVIALSVLVALVAAFRMRRSGAPTTESFLERWIQMAPLVVFGMRIYAALFVVYAFLAFTAFDLGFEVAFPIWLAPVPILVVMGVALGNQTLGRIPTLAMAAVALVASAALFASVGFWFYAPAAACAALAAFLKIVRVSDLAWNPPLVRVGGVMMLFGAIAALALWTSPRTVEALPRGIGPPGWWPFVGVPLALVALAGGVAALRRQQIGLAMVGGLALAASLYFVFPLGLGACGAIVLSRTAFEPRKSFRRGLLGARREMRKTGVYMVHVAFALLTLGFATEILGWAGAGLGLVGLSIAWILSLGEAAGRGHNPSARTVK